jgi:hypothetical protein
VCFPGESDRHLETDEKIPAGRRQPPLSLASYYEVDSERACRSLTSVQHRPTQKGRAGGSVCRRGEGGRGTGDGGRREKRGRPVWETIHIAGIKGIGSPSALQHTKCILGIVLASTTLWQSLAISRTASY